MKQKHRKSIVISRDKRSKNTTHPNSFYITEGVESYKDYEGSIRYPEEVLPINKASKFRRNLDNDVENVCDIRDLRSVDLNLSDNRQNRNNLVSDIDREFDLELDLELGSTTHEEITLGMKQVAPTGEVVNVIEDVLANPEFDWEDDKLTRDEETVTVTEETELLFEDLINDEDGYSNTPTPNKKDKPTKKGMKKIPSKPKPPKKPKTSGGLWGWIKNFFTTRSKPVKTPKPTGGIKPPKEPKPSKSGTKMKPNMIKTPKSKPVKGGPPPLKLNKPRSKPTGKINIKQSPEVKKDVGKSSEAVNSLLNSQTYRPGKEIINKNEKVDGGARDE